MICTIREWLPTDAPALAQALNNKKIFDNLRDGLPYPYTEKDAAAFIAKLRSADPGSSFEFAVVVDGKVVGDVGATRQGNINRYTAELGYYLAEEYWGKGIMTEAVRLLCAHVFASTDINRLYAEAYVRNKASCRVLEKAGFTREGVLRECAVKNGKTEDMVVYSLLRSEYKETQGERV